MSSEILTWYHTEYGPGRGQINIDTSQIGADWTPRDPTSIPIPKVQLDRDGATGSLISALNSEPSK